MDTFTIFIIPLLVFGFVCFVLMVSWGLKMWHEFRLEKERRRPVIGKEIHIDKRV